MKYKELHKRAFKEALMETIIELIKYAFIIVVTIWLVGIVYHL